MIEQICPTNVWKACNPRVYDQLGRFYSSKILGSSLANTVLCARQFGLSSSSVSNQFAVAALLDSHKVPTYFVTTRLLESVNATELDETFRWVDMKFPHPGLAFIFEQGAVKHPTSGDIPFVALGRTIKGTDINYSCSAPSATVQGGGLLMLTATHQSAMFDHYDLAMSDVVTPTIGGLQVIKDKDYVNTPDPIVGEPLSNTERDFNAWLTVLAIKLVLLMIARPTMVERGQRLRTVLKSGSQKEFWSPNILGKSYHATHEKSEPGEKIARRMHWRRGHFRSQAFGVHYAEHRTIWIEPTIIGALT